MQQSTRQYSRLTIFLVQAAITSLLAEGSTTRMHTAFHGAHLLAIEAKRQQLAVAKGDIIQSNKNTQH